jgi:hypothetical protein
MGMTPPWHTRGQQPLKLPRKPEQRTASHRALELPTAADTNATLHTARKSEQALEHGLAERIAQHHQARRR